MLARGCQGWGRMGVRGALMERQWSGRLLSKARGQRSGQHGRCRGRAFQVGLPLMCLLSVCLPYSTGEPVQSWGDLHRG